MRATTKAGMGAVTAAVLLSAYAAGAHHGDDAAAAPAAGAASGAGSGTFTGDAVSTRWGTVQVQITVTDGKITEAKALQYPQDNPRDQEINAYALPILAAEAVAANSADIDAVSGATVTSGGYQQSLQSAVDASHR